LGQQKNGTVTVEVEKRLEDLFREDDLVPDFATASDDFENSAPEELEMSPEFLEEGDEIEQIPPRELEESPDLAEDSTHLEHTPLKELKTIVLSIDWEINDEDMVKFIDQVEKLKVTYEYDRIILLFLQILGSLGKYVKANKGSAHPNAIKVLNSVYTSLEKVILTKGISEAEKEKILLVEVKRFKDLKEQVAVRKPETTEKREAKTALEIEPKVTEPKLKEQKEDIAIQQESEPGERPETGALQSDMSPMTPHEAFAYALEEIKQVLRAEFKALRAELRLWREGQ
jgi:hypothetical protein